MEVKKSIAIILAVLFGFWAWLYTFGKDAWKFWVCFGLNIFPTFFIASVFHFGSTYEPKTPSLEGESMAYALMGAFFLSAGAWSLTWLVAVLDSAIKSKKRYISLSNKSKKVLIPLAVVFGPFSWLYTYHKDWWKFWIGLLIISAGLIVIPRLVATDLFPMIKEYFKAGYIDLRIPFIDRLSLYLENNSGAYIKYYFSSIKPVSLSVPASVWLLAVISAIFRFVRWDEETIRSIELNGATE